jgi:excisionase family DNA binding protein
MDALLTPRQIAEILSVKPATIYQWTHSQYIPHIKLGKFVRFREADIEKWLEKKACKGRQSRRIPIDQLMDSRKR